MDNQPVRVPASILRNSFAHSPSFHVRKYLPVALAAPPVSIYSISSPSCFIHSCHTAVPFVPFNSLLLRSLIVSVLPILRGTCLSSSGQASLQQTTPGCHDTSNCRFHSYLSWFSLRVPCAGSSSLLGSNSSGWHGLGSLLLPLLISTDTFYQADFLQHHVNAVIVKQLSEIRQTKLWVLSCTQSMIVGLINDRSGKL